MRMIINQNTPKINASYNLFIIFSPVICACVRAYPFIIWKHLQKYAHPPLVHCFKSYLSMCICLEFRKIIRGFSTGNYSMSGMCVYREMLEEDAEAPPRCRAASQENNVNIAKYLIEIHFIIFFNFRIRRWYVFVNHN